MGCSEFVRVEVGGFDSTQVLEINAQDCPVLSWTSSFVDDTTLWVLEQLS